MLKETIWKTFEITGSIDAYMFYKEIERHVDEVSIQDIEEK